MAEMNKNQRVAHTAGKGVQTRVKAFYVFTEFQGRGHAKLPIGAFHTLAEAEEFAAEVNGYIIEVTGGKR